MTSVNGGDSYRLYELLQSVSAFIQGKPRWVTVATLAGAFGSNTAGGTANSTASRGFNRGGASGREERGARFPERAGLSSWRRGK